MSMDKELATAYSEIFGATKSEVAGLASEQAASSRQEPEYQLNVDEVGLPLMIADAQGRVQHLNASFRAILAAARAVRVTRKAKALMLWASSLIMSGEAVRKASRAPAPSSARAKSDEGAPGATYGLFREL